jgi:hypothetical protein
MLRWPPLPRLPYLAFERRFRDATVRAVLPASADGRFLGLSAVDLGAFWVRFEQAAPLLLRLGLRLAVWELALLPLLGQVRDGLRGPWRRSTWPRLLRPRLLADLSDDDKDALLGTCSHSWSYTLRQSLVVVRLAACFAAFAEEAVRAPFEGESGAMLTGGRS